MFTGIITATSNIKNIDNTENNILKMFIEKPSGWNIKNGDSISINGTCLTVKSVSEDDFTVQLMQETLSKTIFGENIPKTVNLEQAISANEKFEGHFVQGHVDTIGEIMSIENDEYVISFPNKYKHLVVEKGSIAVNGVSLTAHSVTNNSFTVSLIPYTLENTTFRDLQIKDAVNLEFDIVGKYLARFRETNYEPKQ